MNIACIVNNIIVVEMVACFMSNKISLEICSKYTTHLNKKCFLFLNDECPVGLEILRCIHL